jgi:hypothetical protein
MSELTSKSLSICPHRFDGRRELCSLCAELPPSKKLDLLPCPFCGSSRIEIHEEFGGSSCSKCGALGPTRGPKDMLQRWNQRYSADEPPAGQYCEHGVRSDLRCFSCNPASSQPPPAVRYWEYLDKYAPDHVSEASAFLVKLMCDYADRRGSGEAKAAMIGTAVDFLSQWAMLQPCSTATKGPDVCSGCGHVFPIAPDHPAYGKPCPEEKCPRSGEGENHER